jgi:transposase
MDRQELSDALWEGIEPHLRGKASDPGRTGRDNRLFVEAVLWLARSGAHWRVLPKEFGRLACCRFGGHRDRVFPPIGGPQCKEGSSAASSSLRR